MKTGLTYAIVTAARDEADNLRRLASSLAQQTATPAAWVIVDDGSSDGTPALARQLGRQHPWISLAVAGGAAVARGGPVVRAFHTGLATITALPDVVVKLDADISIEPDYFARLLDEFERDPRLGIAGGTLYEQDAGGVWRERHSTGPPVWGACRAYRQECLREILPLEEHMGWDTLDLVKANVRGWKTEVFYDLPFRHHRPEGERDGSRLRTSIVQGEGTYFMGYRPSYLLVRTLYRARRNPAAVGQLMGYARARLERRPRCADSEVIAAVRRQQSLRRLPLRIREKLRPRATLAEPLG